MKGKFIVIANDADSDGENWFEIDARFVGEYSTIEEAENAGNLYIQENFKHSEAEYNVFPKKRGSESVSWDNRCKSYCRKRHY